MSILGNDLLLGSGDEGYNLTRSLRIRKSASAYLNRTPASAGNRQIFTFSGWVKRGTLGARQGIIVCTDAPANNYFDIEFIAADQLDIQGSNGTWRLATSAVYRDPSAWYHIVLAVDTTQATASNRVKLYVNGSQVTAFSTASYPTLNSNCYFNLNAAHSIGSWQPASGLYFDGYMTEVNFIDGQALTPSSFGSTNALTGVWQPAAYTGTYGTNGFELQFTDNSALTTSSNVGLGKDFSGNGNYWTTNNISITSGVTYDSMTDVPTLTSATASNFAVLNPLDNGGATVNAANLNWDSGGNQGTRASFFVSTGKYYWEITSTEANLIGEHGVAPATKSLTGGDAFPGSSTGGWGFSNNSGNKSFNGTQTNITTAGTNGDVMMYALNMDTGKIWFGRNGTWFSSGNPAAGTNEAFSSVTGTLSPMTGVGGAAAGSVAYNFGQRPFTYTPPTGFVALNTFNLPTSTIVKGNTVMDATLWTGDGTSPRTITNASGFKPDLVWFKTRSTTFYNQLSDSVLGATRSIYSNVTNAEENNAINGYLSSINSNGFSVINGSSSGGSVNANGTTYVAWQWQAGQGTTSSNTNGTITSTVSVNASAGFSVVTYTGNGSAGATIGHSLGVAPSWIFIKSRSTTGYWIVYNAVSGATKYLTLNTSDAVLTNAGPFNNTAPTSSVFSVGSSADVNSNGTTYVAYCWTPIAGYSSFGSYVGNGSTDGPFLYLGFRPKYLLLKCTTTGGAGYDWYVLDSVRNAYNFVDNYLYPNYSNAEAASGANFSFDFVSNGIKIRGNGNGQNQNGQTYAYACWAENPFKNALAR